eukprot:s825_g12.t1
MENNEEAPKDEDAEEQGTEEVEAEKDDAKDWGLANSEGEEEEGVRDEVDETLEENTAAPTHAEERPPHHFLKLLQRSYCIQADEVARRHGQLMSLMKGEHVEEKAEQSEEAIQKEVAESVEREDAAPKPESNPQEEAGGPEAPATLGPYIFASCHEDVLQYLQPQFVCYCAVGQKPKLLANPHAGRAPRIEGVMEGDTMPVYHDLIGTWKPQVQSLVCNLKHQTRPAPQSTVHTCLIQRCPCSMPDDDCCDDNCCNCIGGNPAMQLVYAIGAATYAALAVFLFVRDMAQFAGSLVEVPLLLSYMMLVLGLIVAALWFLMLGSRCFAPCCCSGTCSMCHIPARWSALRGALNAWTIPS